MARPITRWFVVCAACLSFRSSGGQAAPPPYEILLRSRVATVTPETTKDAQTGGGFIQVTQLEPNAVMVLMRGAAATGSGHTAGTAAMQFNLNQDFEIVPTRVGLRPPRLVLSAWLIGALDSTRKSGGYADHAPACAAIGSGEHSILNLCINPHSVGAGQNLLLNDRAGPLELTAAPGAYCLRQNFALSASQPKNHCNPGNAAADFDPEPKLDVHWNYVLKPFRAVPHRNFGFRVIVQVIEEPATPAAPAPETLPLPTPEKKQKAGKE